MKNSGAHPALITHIPRKSTYFGNEHSKDVAMGSTMGTWKQHPESAGIGREVAVNDPGTPRVAPTCGLPCITPRRSLRKHGARRCWGN